MSTSAIDCIQKWEEDLRATNSILVEKKAELSAKKTTAENSQILSTKLNGLMDRLEITDRIAKELGAQIKNIPPQLQNIGEDTKAIKEVLEIIFCLLKKFYQCSDDITLTCKNMRMQIETIDESAVLESSIILTCFEDVCLKVQIAIESQEEVLNSIVEILQCAFELQEVLSGKACSITTLIAGQIQMIDHGPSKPVKNCHSSTCKGKIRPLLTMPLSCDKFYIKTKVNKEKAATEFSQAEIDHAECLKKHTKLVSLKTNLVEAIAAAKEAKNLN